jgi:DNA repair exonuclease SbcCD ATPase subunit
MTYPLYINIETTCFDGEGDAADAAAAAAEAKAEEAKAAAAKAAADDAAKTKEKTFTQTEVNRITGQRNAALKERYGALEATYTELLEQTNLTEAAREKMEAELEQIQAQMRTKEQQQEFERKQAQSKFENELKKANEKGEKYETLFKESVTKRAITDAALANDGCNADDFIAHLSPKTVMVFEQDAEGKPTDNMVPMVNWDLRDEETGVVTKVQKTPEEIVKIMQDDKAKYGHLFKSNVVAGVGAGTANASPNLSGKIDPKTLTTADFMKLSETEEGRRQLGLSK